MGPFPHHGRHSMSRPNPLGLQVTTLGSWEHYTLRGSGRSAESFSAYSCIGEWKKTELVCHRRSICFFATAVTFLEKHRTSQAHSTSRHVLSPGPSNLGCFVNSFRKQISHVAFTALVGAVISGNKCFVMLFFRESV